MERLSKRLNKTESGAKIPQELVDAASHASKTIRDPAIAREAFEQLAPILENYAPNKDFTMACGMLVEKQRIVEGMLDLWEDLSEVFPEDLTPLRMMMRWYRRHRRIDEGLAKINSLFPSAHEDLEEAEKATIGLAELKRYNDIDHLMATILPQHPKARSIRMRYIKTLNEQSRYIEAKEVADTVRSPQRLGQSSQELLNLVERRAKKMSELYSTDQSDVFERIIALAPRPKGVSLNAFGPITFLTGQLGAGGAERQMTRLASAFQNRFQKGQTAGGLALTSPIDVVVRHASSASGSDFFLPELKAARINTAILTDKAGVDLHELEGISSEVLNLLELLPQDVFEHTCKLIPYFQSRRSQIVYLWQDGGVLAAAVAAILAGVPRIVTSFRGLPPNLRPELYRRELFPLFQALSKLPYVTFSSNSASTARAYEDWLSLPTDCISVVPNASPAVLPTGSPEDHQLWERIESKSPSCTKTVIGVFRFTENKRPDLWVETAAQYAMKHKDTRFILIGTGYLHGKCLKRVAELGFKNRIFLVGLQNNVGFYLHKSDLLMHLAEKEGLPNVVIEAQLAGLPVLATPAGGTGEVVQDGVTGVLLPSAETPTIRDTLKALTALLADNRLRGAMGMSAKQIAEPKYLIDHVVDRTAQLFTDKKEI